MVLCGNMLSVIPALSARLTPSLGPVMTTPLHALGINYTPMDLIDTSNTLASQPAPAIDPDKAAVDAPVQTLNMFAAPLDHVDVFTRAEAAGVNVLAVRVWP